MVGDGYSLPEVDLGLRAQSTLPVTSMAAGKIKSDAPELWLRLVRAPKLIDLNRESLAIVRKGRDIFWAAIGVALLLHKGFSLRRMEEDAAKSVKEARSTGDLATDEHR